MFGSSPAPASPKSKDPIVGLDVGGQVFYFTKSKLVTSGSVYLMNLLEGGNEEEATPSYKDAVGRRIFFLDRSPDLFRYVRDVLVGNIKGQQIPLETRRQLRKEAEFLGFPGLAMALQVSQSFRPSVNPCQGVLYWLGTKDSAGKYVNPYSLGLIDVTGWMDDDNNAEEDMFDLARFARSRETFVEYRCKPQVQKARGANAWEMEQFSCLQWCQHATKRLPVVIDFRTNLRLRVTHYSLRVSECMGLAGDWNLEGSNDGEQWTVLHASRNDHELFLEEGNDEIKRQLTKTLSFYNDHVQGDELAGDVLLQILEQDFRHTWVVDDDAASKEFYRYFRFIGAGDPSGEDACLHGEGLELFGDVYEA